MFGLGPATKIYIAVERVDMRKGFDGLYRFVRDRLGEDQLGMLALGLLQPLLFFFMAGLFLHIECVVGA